MSTFCQSVYQILLVITMSTRMDGAPHIPPRYKLNYIIIIVLLQRNLERRTHPCLIFYVYPPYAPAQSTRRRCRRRRRRVLALADPSGRHYLPSPQTPFLTANIIPHTWPAGQPTRLHTQRTPVHPPTQRTRRHPAINKQASKQAPHAQALAVAQGQLPRQQVKT
jgi:hypothetical protein